MAAVFDYVNSITLNKNNLITDAESEAGYNPFLTNRALSYFTDTLLYAQEMNRYPNLDKKLQYDYFLNSIKPKKRFSSKWAKRIENDDIKVIQEYYNYSYSKAKIALSILSDTQVQELRKRMDKGGNDRNNI